MQTPASFNINRLVRQCYGVGRHNSTWQNTIGCCRQKSDRYTLSGWNCLALCHSVHPSSGQQHHISARQRATTCCASSAWLSDTAKCWFVTMASSFTRSFTHWACLGWNGMPNQPVTLTEMGLALIRIWNNIPQAFFNNWVRSIHRRCQACINANGGHTRYWLC